MGIFGGYGVSSRHQTTPFECVKSGRSAFRWVREHAIEMGVDPLRVMAAGGSAGGHAAACAGIIERVEEACEDSSISLGPNAMILFNRVIDITERGFGVGKIGRDRETEISPVHHVRSGTVPTLILHGAAGMTKPFENSKRFTRPMRERGNVRIGAF